MALVTRFAVWLALPDGVLASLLPGVVFGVGGAVKMKNRYRNVTQDQVFRDENM